MKCTTINSESTTTLSKKDAQFVRLLIDAIGYEGVRSIAERKISDIKKLERLQIKVIEQFECARCGECCKTCDVELTDDDIVRMCKHIGMEFDEFYNRFMNHLYISNYLLSPCPFLINNRCSIYAFRPETCRVYPFADDTMAVSPCKLGSEILKILIKIFGNATPKAQDEKTIAAAAHFRDSVIDIGHSTDNNQQDVDKYLYTFVTYSNLEAILKYIRRQEHHRKEMLARGGD